MKRKSRDTRRLCLESLEQRELMAGNVQVTVKQGVLRLVGDDRANAVEVYQDASCRSGQFLVVPVASSGPIDTLINGRAGTPQKFSGVTRGIQADMKGGDDALLIVGPGAYTASVPGPVGVVVDMGAGDDYFGLSNVKVAGSCTISGQAGNDRIRVGLSTIKINLVIDAGGGNDDVALNDTKVGGNLTASMGAGDDQLRIYGTSADSIYTAMGDGNDYFLIRDSSSNALPSFDGGNGKDTLAYYNNKFPRRFVYAPPYCVNWEKIG